MSKHFSPRTQGARSLDSDEAHRQRLAERRAPAPVATLASEFRGMSAEARADKIVRNGVALGWTRSISSTALTIECDEHGAAAGEWCWSALVKGYCGYTFTDVGALVAIEDLTIGRPPTGVLSCHHGLGYAPGSPRWSRRRGHVGDASEVRSVVRAGGRQTSSATERPSEFDEPPGFGTRDSRYRWSCVAPSRSRN